jgi:hypothetical protein
MKKNILIVLFIISNALLIFTCKNQDQPESPPQRVTIVTKTPEYAILEQGIDTIPEKDAIKLEWHPNSERNLNGYAVFRSKWPDKNYLEITRIKEIYGTIDTTFIDDSVQVNNRYYYYIRAFIKSDLLGEPSDTVNYQLIPKPQLLGTSLKNEVFLFRWTYSDPVSAPDDFVFRLQRKINFNEYQNLNPSVNSIRYTFPEEWSLEELGYDNQLSAGEYNWWIDAFIPGQNMGAESNIWQFQIK